MKIILLSGYRGSGKDTAANHLVQTRNYERRAFADSLKDDVAKFLGINRMDMDDPDRKEKPILHRPVLATDTFSRMITEYLSREFRTKDGVRPNSSHWLGDKLIAPMCDGLSIEGKQLFWTPRAACIFIGSSGRAYNPNHWVDRALQNVDKNDKIVVSDFRYVSEYYSVSDMYGKENVETIRIERFNDIDSSDDSERNLDNFDFDVRVSNKGTIDDFMNILEVLV